MVINVEQEFKVQEAPIDFMVWGGGGAKGASYPGAYKALKNSGVFNGIKTIAGSSAGAIIAGLTASGIDPERLIQLSKDADLQKLLDTKGMLINADSIGLYNFLAENIKGSIADFLNEKDIAQICDKRFHEILEEQTLINNQENAWREQERAVFEEIKELRRQLGVIRDPERQDKIQEQIQALEVKEKAISLTIEDLLQQENILQKKVGTIERMMADDGQGIKDLKNRVQSKDGKIYFKDIAFLHSLEPTRFKDLIITAVRRDNGELKIFSAQDTPDVEIAEACRASAAIPLVVKPIVIDGVEYVDGGYRDNIPIKYFDESNKDIGIEEVKTSEQLREAKKNGRVLAFTFGSGMDAAANIAIYSNKEKIISFNSIVQFLVDVAYKALAKVGGTFKYTETLEQTYQNVRENALGTVVLDTKDVGTLSFDTAHKKADYLSVKGYIDTQKYLANQGLASAPDLELREFCLQMQEEIQGHADKKSSWLDKINKRAYEQKAAVLLSFCEESVWQGRDKSAVMEKFMVETLRNPGHSKSGIDDKSMNKLIKTLNSPQTPDEIKLSAVKALRIDGNDQRFSQDVVKFKFSKEDFKGLTERNPEILKSTPAAGLGRV